MSERKVPLEQPPNIEDPALREWLTRMMIMINLSFDRVDTMTQAGQIPDKLENGMMRYFVAAIPTTAITSPGPWMVVEGVWQKMTV